MIAGKIALLAVLLVIGLGTSAHFAGQAFEHIAPPPGPTSDPTARGQDHRARRERRPGGRVGRERAEVEILGLELRELGRLAAIEVGAGIVLLAGLQVALAPGRMRARGHRPYELYELHLSSHDEAKPQDLEDMIEAIGNIVRVFPSERARRGQPYVAVELLHDLGQSGDAEWVIGVRCEPRSVAALDAAISAAYPDVRLGHPRGGAPQPRPGRFREPGHVMRFRKERAWIYPLVAPGETLASPPLEQIAHTQAAAGGASVVRFQLLPTPTFFETIARRAYRHQENKLARAGGWGLPEAGLTSVLNNAELANARRTQNRGVFWLEVVVAADTPEACKTIAAAVQARRGENRLHRRWMHVRQNLYRRRFPHALGPLLPSPRALVSAAEAAHLLELPSARMKGVPVRRVTVPRIPAPPEVLRATTLEPVPQPPTERTPPVLSADP